jgi:pimeloyl-ACP methyl ester carboxylesterase
LDPYLYAEAEVAVDRLLPRWGVPVARRVADLPSGRVHYLEAGSGPPVVLLHGGFGGAGNWYRTLGPLSLRYRVLAPDRPGYGLSADSAVGPLDWLDAWLAAVGVERAALVGHAAGAAVALAYAQTRPARVRALALGDFALAEASDPPGTAPPAGTVARGEPARPAGAPTRAGAPGPRARAAPATATGAGGTPGQAAAPRRPRRVETWYASLAARFDDRRLLAPEYLYYLWCLAQLRPAQDQRPPGDAAPGPVAIPAPGARTWPAAPILLVWGRGNRWSGVPLARQLHQRIPDAWLRVIEHSRGIPQLEQPGEYNYAVMTFLARLTDD